MINFFPNIPLECSLLYGSKFLPTVSLRKVASSPLTLTDSVRVVDIALTAQLAIVFLDFAACTYRGLPGTSGPKRRTDAVVILVDGIPVPATTTAGTRWICATRNEPLRSPISPDITLTDAAP